MSEGCNAINYESQNNYTHTQSEAFSKMKVNLSNRQLLGDYLLICLAVLII